jgi:hypothetical protein
MKQSLLFLAILFVSVSCLKDDGGSEIYNPRQMSVSTYLQYLRSGRCDFVEMPIFDISDIPELLKYARDEQTIVFAVVNPFSSVPPPRAKSSVGMTVLWTIEGTRLDVDYPSATATVMDDDTNKAIQQSEVAVLYERWWERNSGKTLAQLKEISPLEETGYSWH